MALWALKAVPRTEVHDLGKRIVVDLDVPQSVIRFGTFGVAWRDPGFVPAAVLEALRKVREAKSAQS